MGILDFETAAKSSTTAARTQGQRPAQQDRPEAEYWINLGYSVDTQNDDGDTSTMFVSLATGIPLDTMSDFDLSRINSPTMRNLRQAQNDLKDQLLQAAATLEPGGSIIIMTDDNTGLQVELRRRKGAQAPSAIAENPLARKLNFAS